MTRINAEKGANNRFCKDWSPLSIGKPDPFNEMFVKLWKEGKKEEAKKFGRSIRYLANIKVLKDPANPDNEDKFFLLDMSPTLFDKIKQAIQPSEDELAIDPDLKPKNVFDPIKGHSFLLKTKRGENGFVTYIDSKFAEKEDGIYKSEEEAIKDIKENGAYSVGDFLKPETFKSYKELKECLNWFMGIENTEKSEPTPEVQETPVKEVQETPVKEVQETPAEVKESKVEADEDLDSLLNELDNI